MLLYANKSAVCRRLSPAHVYTSLRRTLAGDIWGTKCQLSDAWRPRTQSASLPLSPRTRIRQIPTKRDHIRAELAAIY